MTANDAHDQAREHSHDHQTGVHGFLHNMFVPHTHDPSNAVDDALEASVAGVKAVKVSMIALFITTVLQGIVVAFSGSVALLADTIHNFSDAFTAVPLWIAFALSRRAATRRYTYGFNRAEDLAGLCIVVMIALSAVLAAWQAIDRIINPQPIDYAGWVIAAGAIGFLGNEAVAIYRIRVGGKIGSAALVADGIHARTDGFTSLGVVLGGFGVLVGFPLADPIIGLLISAMIVVLLIGTVRSVGRRLMDGVEPELLDRVENAIGRVPAVTTIDRVRLRWVGHRLYGEAIVHIPDVSLLRANRIAIEVEDSVKQHLPNIDDMVIRTLAK
ncbi:cation diffusion facilitator family transporter [Paramicrobacterium agarici]|nr:cation diffusion facilitator family transporter [Microbacterium agarici]